MFIANLIHPEVENDLLKQTVEPRQALELAINMELGMYKQHQTRHLIPAILKGFTVHPALEHQTGHFPTISTNKAGVPLSIAQDQ